MLKNRIEKNWKKLQGWRKQNRIDAFRVYDRDIPEFQVIIDCYLDQFIIYDRTDSLMDADKDIRNLAKTALIELFPNTENKIIWKTRERQSGLNQYEKLDQTGESFLVQEGPAKFQVNLKDYLDTGLFLDHRPMRSKFYKISQGKKILNLFCYTGSVSVCAALGGARTTSIDMSSTYLDWAQNNFKENSIPLMDHQFIRADVLEWLRHENPSEKFDLIFLDPPTFSNSKKMKDDFEVEKDQEYLVDRCMGMLKKEGTLFFSTNKRKFKLSSVLMERFYIKDISQETIPRDFHDLKIHQCFEISFKK